jgi:CBS domain-containing protein
MRIEQLYRPEVVVADAGEALVVVARRMQEHQVGALPILEDERIIGIVSERDLVRALGERADPDTVVAWYASPVPTCAGLDEDSTDVGRRMLELGVRHLPVVRDGRVVGMVSMRDLLALETWLPGRPPANGGTEAAGVRP